MAMSREDTQYTYESDLSTSSEESEDSEESEESEEWRSISNYVQLNLQSLNTRLFSYLALLKVYVPESYLLLSDCQTVLGPPDLIFGGPPFEERMSPFISCINTDTEQISLKNTDIARRALEILEGFQMSKVTIAENLIQILCSSDEHTHIAPHIKTLLTKRQNLVEGKKKFSQFIIECSFGQAVSILKTASDKFRNNAIYPQTVARVYYIRGSHNQNNIDEDIYQEAEKWAIEAIGRAPHSSYIADTLGQIYKNKLMRAPSVELAKEALKAFEDVECKAEAEDEPGLIFTNEGYENFPKTFNNRGLFGFIQVAKIIYEKKLPVKIPVGNVEEKFHFFEWYLAYSRPDRNTFEPPYFNRDVETCFWYYTKREASESTSFPGLLKRLDFEGIQNLLRINWEANQNVSDAERYNFSNILLSNQNSTSVQLAPVKDLKTIMEIIMRSTHEIQSPEFYLLFFLLFWPEGGMEQGPEGAIALEEQVNKMEVAFERARYAKYLQGRYLVPLFFLGNGPGLTKWVRRAKLDAIVERTVNDQFDDIDEKEFKIECCRIWSSGEVWDIPEVQQLLRPVNVEPYVLANVEQEEMIWVQTGRAKVSARTDEPLDAAVERPTRFYLGFNIQGPVVFKV